MNVLHKCRINTKSHNEARRSSIGALKTNYCIRFVTFWDGQIC
jgi:hypothetical protein